MVSEGLSHKSVVLANENSVLEQLCRKLLDEASKQGFEREDLFAIHLALEEAFLNAVKHGNKMDPNKKVYIKYLITPQKFDISVGDDGCGFNPSSVPDPREGDNLYKSSGRGLLLMRSYMDTVEYNKQGNCVHMVKFRENTKSKADSKNIR